jgi:Fe2+ or Zn2+ uptake regulation protein
MKLLCEAGLAHERHFDDGITRYEIEHEHHDHLVCTKCGKIIEFECEMIEAAQTRSPSVGFRCCATATSLRSLQGLSRLDSERGRRASHA